ncbi:hypothetical protein DPMN_150628 [Dreissena polymorpha]|uniref:Uncharacterized protein n=1 Tax=Dreissena polymorpha TaxID=45954 RepID=A0A9D4FGU5_DREPO|nr:hypothetical protein DPMN_150628 [Dreissena polymorpha]
MEEMLERAGVNDADVEIKGPTQVLSYRRRYLSQLLKLESYKDMCLKTVRE